MFTELRTFLIFAEEGSIQRVARRLPLTQPAISRQLQRLERALGGDLLDRRQKPPVLTPFGIEVQARAKGLLHGLEELKELARDTDPRGFFRLGLVNGIAHASLAEHLAAVVARFPSVTLRIKSGWSDDLAELYRLGAVDAAIVMSDAKRFHDATNLGQEWLTAIGSPSANRLPVETIERGWILSPAPCDARRGLADCLARQGKPFVIAAEVEHLPLQVGLVGKGFGLGLVPRRLFERGEFKEVERVAILEDDLCLDVLMLVSPHLGPLTKVADAIEREMRTFLKQ